VLLRCCAPVCPPGPRIDVFNRARVDLELPREWLSSSLQPAYSEVQLADAIRVNSKDILVRRPSLSATPPSPPVLSFAAAEQPPELNSGTS
ncbi:hypothetical protein GBAR_LOCUS17274, partial [Geodia barretti]